MVYPAPSPAEFEPPVVEIADHQIEAFIEVLCTARDNWRHSRDDPAQQLNEDELHERITTLNKLIERTESVAATNRENKLKLRRPEEIEEIIFSILTILHGLNTGEIDYGPKRNKRAIEGYEAMLETFTNVHWEDNPLTRHWHHFGDITPDSPEDPIIKAIAEYGDRTHLLRELLARKTLNYSLSAYENPKRLNADPNDPEDIAKKFIENWDETRESMGKIRYKQWLNEAEGQVGGAADILEEAFSTTNESPTS